MLTRESHRRTAARMFADALLVCLFATSGCATILDIDGDYGNLEEKPDARAVVSDDAGIEPGPAVACSTPPGDCARSIPSGWSLALLATDRATACPIEFAPKDVVSDPVAAAGACDCGCTVDDGASCSIGTMRTKFGTSDACSSNGTTIQVAGPSCSSLSGNLSTFFSATAPPPTISCTASVKADAARVTVATARLCDVPPRCHEDVCSGVAPAGFAACISTSGHAACPTGWGTPRYVGDGTDLSCSACECQASATCAGSIQFFTDVNCNTPLVTLDVNGVCVNTNGAGHINAYKYAATLSNPACRANGAKVATTGLTAERTVCCKP